MNKPKIKDTSSKQQTSSEVCKEAMSIVSKDVREPEVKYRNPGVELAMELVAKDVRIPKFLRELNAKNQQKKKMKELKLMLKDKLQPFLSKLPDDEARDYVLELIIQTYKDYETPRIKKCFKPKILRAIKILNEEYLDDKIKNLKESLKISESCGDETRAAIEYYEIKALEDLKDNCKEINISDENNQNTK